MNILTKNQRIDAFVKLGKQMLSGNLISDNFLESTYYRNPWFTPENTRKQIDQIASSLTENKLTKWLSQYECKETQQTVGLILAGNIPLVGFHDILCVLISGYSTKIKISSNDAGLTKAVVDILLKIEPAFEKKIEFVDKLNDFDLVIATGSNNSARYFEYYFGKKPNIIRKNRNAVAVLTGDESQDEIRLLGADIFTYFGLGCRSVSKLFIPDHFKIESFFEAIESYSTIAEHFKYNNNYDYNKSIYLVNGDAHFDNGFVLLKEDTELASPLAVLHFERYKTLTDVEQYLISNEEYIQCVVGNAALKIKSPTIRLGNSQCPDLEDYADHINTLDFLAANSLSRQ